MCEYEIKTNYKYGGQFKIHIFHKTNNNTPMCGHTINRSNKNIFLKASWRTYDLCQICSHHLDKLDTKTKKTIIKAIMKK